MSKLAEVNNDSLKALTIAANEKHPVSMLEQLGVGQRLINLLHSNNVFTMFDLLNKSKQDLLKMQNFGRRQLEILFEALSKYHLIEE